MIARAAPAERALSLARVSLLASIVFLGLLPVLAVVVLFANVVFGETEVVDFHSFYSAGQALLDGESPYPDYVYPPLTALVATPLALFPLGVAEVLAMLGLIAAVVGTLLLLGVRDWRCYGVAFLWPPVLSAIQTGNITMYLGLGAALAWRFRERAGASSLSIGFTLAAKFFLWPLVVWLAATRRFFAAVLACLAGAGILLASWAVIGFAGVGEYGSIVRRVQGTVESDSYTTYVVALDLGASPEVARATWLVLALGLLGGSVLLGRRNDQAGFILAIAAALAFSPIVWLHYFALLLVVVAVAQPTLGLIWFVPLAMVLTPGSGHPTPFETAATLVVAAVTTGLALRTSVAKTRAAAGAEAGSAPTRPRPHVA